jgi:hypothetical protein
LTGEQVGGVPIDGSAAGAHAETRVAGRRVDSDGGIAAVVFALLVIGCFAALLITQRLKHTPTLVQQAKLTRVIAPASTGESREEHIAFKLAKADEVTVSIESSSAATVATLVRDLPVGRYKTLSLRWNGDEGTAHGYGILRKADGYTTLLPRIHGVLAPPGEYSVRVSLRKEGRSVPFPRTFKLVGP